MRFGGQDWSRGSSSMCSKCRVVVRRSSTLADVLCRLPIVVHFVLARFVGRSLKNEIPPSERVVAS
jgi:hypothetical protein